MCVWLGGWVKLVCVCVYARFVTFFFYDTFIWCMYSIDIHLAQQDVSPSDNKWAVYVYVCIC